MPTFEDKVFKRELRWKQGQANKGRKPSLKKGLKSLVSKKTLKNAAKTAIKYGKGASALGLVATTSAVVINEKRKQVNRDIDKVTNSIVNNTITYPKRKKRKKK